MKTYDLNADFCVCEVKKEGMTCLFTGSHSEAWAEFKRLGAEAMVSGPDAYGFKVLNRDLRFFPASILKN